MKLANLSMTALVAIFNALSDKPATNKTFSQRSKAVERIEALAKAQKINIGQRFNEDGSKKPAEKKAPAPKPSKPIVVKAPKIDKKGKKSDALVIRVEAEKLLLVVEGKDPDGRPLGIPYDRMLATILKKFPEANTTVACLRWYAVHMRGRGERVPNRPRVPAANKGE